MATLMMEKMPALHVDYYGNTGVPLLFIHGWGMHSGMWGEVLAPLATQYRVMAVDLPGHGYSHRSAELGVQSAELGERGVLLSTQHSALSSHYLDAIVEQLAAQFTEPLTVCGWSLGGQIALRWAERFPQQIQRLILVSSTPCFAQREDWSCAMDLQTLNAFATSLQQDYATTLRRFLALLVRGSEQERELLAVLRGLLKARSMASPIALQAGLEILRDVDLRAVLPSISQQALVIAGVRDTLNPLAASQYMAAYLPVSRLAAIEGAAHTPFLSHPAIFIELMRDFLHE